MDFSRYLPRALCCQPRGSASQEDLSSPTPTPAPITTVVIGAGVIGLSTAYYLALALNKTASYMPPSSEPDIVVIDSSHDICPGASGKATGSLGDFGFGSETALLGTLSYQLHKELASKYNGGEIYEFSDLKIFRVSKNDTGNPSTPDTWGPSPPVNKTISDLPSWINPSNDWDVQSLAEVPYASHLDPEKFCRFLRHRCEMLGIRFLLNSAVISVQRNDARQSFTGVTVQTRDETHSTHTIACRAVVIAAGPWSTRVFSRLFPAGRLDLRMDSTNSAGHYALVRNPRWTPGDDEHGVTQIYLNDVANGLNRLDITSFLSGYLYIGGWGAKPERLPEFAEGVQGQPDEIEAMLNMVRQYLRLEAHEELEIVKSGRAYRPLTAPNIPTITKVNWEMLGNSKATPESEGPRNGFKQQQQQQHGSPVIGGLYLNTGHNSDGITLGPGSGKVMSELLLGRTPSVSTSNFGFTSTK